MNPCGTTQAHILEKTQVHGVSVYFGTGVNPANSPAQFFVAWGREILAGGLVHTYNSRCSEEGCLWFVEEDEAEIAYAEVQTSLRG
ncbi:Hypothetical protein DEACI_0665 [Acididesulfobacillus acetoxydans]|uniref:Uncharacterized protein n=1 Tax=Acididesulfobacillus acetoxydans TaxID=1561005 RepID=A0A8S0XAK7_9FIRM|nr:hypothetical protein [Acididesulfobacillus acetoxydans]CAA7600016.1 Hypothetical protein DEACI_0665 [Acididesulfobacillus acetoxydans]CEJ06002.1 Hypothetical protein DEACI_0422 [Acididesulfobacillus acetoxydans]